MPRDRRVAQHSFDIDYQLTDRLTGAPTATGQVTVRAPRASVAREQALVWVHENDPQPQSSQDRVATVLRCVRSSHASPTDT